MKTIRKKVLEYLGTHGIATALEISQLLRLSPADIRHHLASLEEDGLVVTLGHRKENKPGRSSKIFALASRSNANNLSILADSLLTERQENESEKGKNTFLRKIARMIGGEEIPAISSSSQRYSKTVTFLNSMNYEARWEAHSQAPKIYLGHCPYLSILASHPEMCKIDAFLIEQLSRNQAEQTSKLELDTQGRRFCIFLLE